MRTKNLAPFKNEKAFQLYKSQLPLKQVLQAQQECHVPASREYLVKDKAKQAARRNSLDATAEELMRFAVAASKESSRGEQKLMQATNDSAKVTQTSTRELFKQEEQLMNAIDESTKMVEVQHECRDEKAFELYKSRLNHKGHSSHHSFAATEEGQLIFALLASEESFRNEEKLMQATKKYECFRKEERLMQAIDDSTKMIAQVGSKSELMQVMHEFGANEQMQQHYVVLDWADNPKLEVVCESTKLPEVSLKREEPTKANMQQESDANRTETQDDYHVLNESDDLNIEEWTVVND